MLMMLVALSFGISVLVATKVILGSVFSFLLYQVTRMWGFCCGRRNHYRDAAYRNKLGLKEHYSR